MPRKRKTFRNPNGYGSITKLSGNRRRPFMVKVNTTIDDRGYPQYDILGYFDEREKALIALAEYNKSPYDINAKQITFKEVYNLWYNKKFVDSNKVYSKSSIACTAAAFKKVASLHDMLFSDIKTAYMQEVLDNYTLPHAYMEHIKNLFNQVYKYALEYDIVQKDYSKFVTITKEDDDEHGVPFTTEEIHLLWSHKDEPYVDTILILIYSGWRIGELLIIPKSDVDIKNWTFKGGIKTRASKNRVVPIHSAIQLFVERYYSIESNLLIRDSDGRNMSRKKYATFFNEAVEKSGITSIHTPHDCRHTFATLLDNAGANTTAIKRLIGHSTNDITEKIYTHKNINELRKNIELIKPPQL